jgi:hypothetical protein
MIVKITSFACFNCPYRIHMSGDGLSHTYHQFRVALHVRNSSHLINSVSRRSDGRKNPEEHDGHNSHDKHDKRNGGLTEKEQHNNLIAQKHPSLQRDDDDLSDSTQQIDDATNDSGPSSSSSSPPPLSPSNDRDDIQQQAIATLDKDWAPSTWAMKKTSYMGELLEQAGGDGTWIKKKTTRDEVAQFIVGRRDNRAAARKVGARKVKKALATNIGRSVQGVDNAEKSRNFSGSTDARPSNDLIKVDRSEKEINDRDVQPADSLLHPGNAGKAAPVSKAMAAGYLQAIRKQYQLDLDKNNRVDPIYIDTSDPGSATFRRETPLKAAGGSLIFLSEIQDLVRQLTRLHKIFDPDNSDTIFQDPTVSMRARRDHIRASDELANALGDFIEEEGVDGSEVARGLVHQFFGLEEHNDGS